MNPARAPAFQKSASTDAGCSIECRCFVYVSFHEQLRDRLVPKYSELVYNGFWSTPEREALQALVTETQRGVPCVVRLKLYKGNIIVAGRKTPKSLCDRKIPTMEGDAAAYDQTDAIGFIRLNALRLKLRVVLSQR